MSSWLDPAAAGTVGVGAADTGSFGAGCGFVVSAACIGRCIVVFTRSVRLTTSSSGFFWPLIAVSHA